MDRDQRWERTRQAYDALAGRAGLTATNALSLITEAYTAGVTDEFIEPWDRR